MKTKAFNALNRAAIATALLMFAGLSASHGQTSGITNNTLPIVTIRATDPNAAEPAEPGVFTVSRATSASNGGTSNALTVFYAIDGSAINGTDYGAISNWVTIPAGESSAQIAITPIDDMLIENNESVVLRLSPPLIAIPPTYLIGSPSIATVTIADNDGPPETNHPPVVNIVIPTNNATFVAPANIQIVAHAEDFDGYVATVEFFVGTNSLGVTTNNPLSTSPINPFYVIWINPPPGEYTLTARATDDDGAKSTSPPVHISVRTALPPVVTIVATDPVGSEIPVVPPGMGMPQRIDPAVFTVFRTGSTALPLEVLYNVSGSASNGVDYAALSGNVTIPAGASSAIIEVDPIDDLLVEGDEFVEIHLPAIACIAIYPPPPGCYSVGSPGGAVAVIKDDDGVSNRPPQVHLVSPTNGSVFIGPLSIPLLAEASDPDGQVVRVEFFAGDRLLGVIPGTNNPYAFIWSNALPGIYALRARAVDNLNAFAWSPPVTISILGTNRPPETNLPPVVTITATDSLAAEGTNCWHWYSNSIGTTVPWPSNFCGINTATFVVRRTGGTNAPLTVNYEIGGSASNGVDYAAIPSNVIIPAGERSIRIVITPIDDTIVECNETVILRLIPPPLVSNTPPPFITGWPAKAAAVIVDNDRPLPTTGILCDGTLHVTTPAANGFVYRLECSVDLTHWVPVCTNTVNEMGVHFADPETQDFATRFYRVVPETSAPAP